MRVAGRLIRCSELCCVLTAEQDKIDLQMDLQISETNFVLKLQSS